MPALPLTGTGRLRLARCIVDDDWPVRRAAERFQVSRTTAARWAARYRELGPAGMADRSCRPHRCPHQLPERTERRIIKPRVTGRLGPARIAWALHLNPSTVHQVLRRYHCPRLAHLDRGTKVPVRRYERDRPGELIHVDVKKLGSIPDGGGHRVTGPARDRKTGGPPPAPARTITRSWATATCIPPWMTTPALVYTEILPDERKDTATAFLRRVHAWYARHGITIEPILSGNGGCYRSVPRR